MIELLERVVHFEREESPQQKLSKLEGLVVQHGLAAGRRLYRPWLPCSTPTAR